MFCRLSAIRRLPHLSAPSKRFTSSLKEGSVAQSKGFGEKERAQENQYAHQQEVREIEKLRAEIEKKKKELRRPYFPILSRL
ncbi:hypothetical protein DFH06DRAFT_448353 [Mycena polygramma]|nr:hypothetical protein DFH06DRAFT_448353 [Mycena polygramma]